MEMVGGSPCGPAEWVALQKHPVFDGAGGKAGERSRGQDGSPSGGRNLAAWDSSSLRLYLWEPEERCLHRLSVRFRSRGESGSAEAAVPSEIIRASVQISLSVSQISLNRDGSAVHLSGDRGVYVIYIFDRISSAGNSSVCRTVFVGSRGLFTGNNLLRVLQASWHPCSVSHLGVLSSDSVFRIFDLSSDIERPEQEYFIQPFEAGKGKNAASILPISFAFGGEHLWDQFSVFILFSDGSIYVLCPVAPFGGVFNLPFVKDIYEDAVECERRSFNSNVKRDCRLAVAWVEATFPELLDLGNQKQSLPVLRAHSYAPPDASLSLQGPLRRVCGGKELEEGSETWEAGGCEGRAEALLYSGMGKDSILVIAWSSGQLQVDALADEIQPLWNPSCAPRLRAASQGHHIVGVAMICEPPGAASASGWVQETVESVWTGRPPPLLRLAVVDLALPELALGHPLSVVPDPLVSERFYCLHGGGVDLITLHFLPFSDLTASGTGPPDGSAASRPPSVWPILTAAAPSSGGQGPPLGGFVVIADSLGESLAVAVTSSECILLETRGYRDVVRYGVEPPEDGHGGEAEDGVSAGELMSRDLLAGPRALVVPDSTSLRSLSPDSIQGRSTLHHYGKLFHENFVEYAHKVHLELGQHGEHVRAIVREQRERLKAAGELLSAAERKEPLLRSRIARALEAYRAQERRLKGFSRLPAADRKPLSAAEKEFKARLERMRDVEVGALRLSIEALEARLRRQSPSPAGGRQASRGRPSTVQRGMTARPPEAHRMAELKASMKKLSLINDANMGKVRLIEQALRGEGGASR